MFSVLTKIRKPTFVPNRWRDNRMWSVLAVIIFKSTASDFSTVSFPVFDVFGYCESTFIDRFITAFWFELTDQIFAFHTSAFLFFEGTKPDFHPLLFIPFVSNHQRFCKIIDDLYESLVPDTRSLATLLQYL